MSRISFEFQSQGNRKVHAYVGQDTSFTDNDCRLYTTVILRFEDLKDQQSVYSGAAISVPEDWRGKHSGNKATARKITKTGVQMALQRALQAFLNDRFASRNKEYEHNYHSLANRFWKAFLPHIDEV